MQITGQFQNSSNYTSSQLSFRYYMYLYLFLIKINNTIETFYSQNINRLYESALYVLTWPTMLHGRVCYILEADSKRPIYKKRWLRNYREKTLYLIRTKYNITSTNKKSIQEKLAFCVFIKAIYVFINIYISVYIYIFVHYTFKLTTTLGIYKEIRG